MRKLAFWPLKVAQNTRISSILAIMNRPIERFLAIGQTEKDTEEEKLRKSGFMIVSGMAVFSTIVWSSFIFAHQLVLPGFAILSGSMLWTVNIVLFSITKRFHFFCSVQLLLLLLIALASHITLGGFVPSGGVIIWAMIAPAGALIFQDLKRASYWFGGFILTIVAAYLVNDLLPEYIEKTGSDRFVMAMFLMNIIGLATHIFLIQYYFVRKITDLNADIETKNIELKQQSEQLREMDEVKSRFFANISHEFRTPLTLILGILNRQSQRSQIEEREQTMMRRNAHQLLQLINQLLDLSKLESGELKLRASKADIVLFTKNLAAQFESMASVKNISMTFNGNDIRKPSDHSLVLFFDHDKLQKVLTNLLSNAVKFTSGDGKIDIEVRQADDREFARVRISNTGDGIPAEKLPYIFDRFYQVNSASNREHEGTGIGLALVKELVELHHGKVWAESHLGVTSFTVLLPMNDDYLREDEKVEVAAWRAEEDSPFLDSALYEESAGVQKHDNELEILVVEDNNDLRTYIRDMLSDGYKVLEAIDGTDGLQQAEAAIPDLIISDVMMPGMDGYDLCRQLKSNDKTNHIPVILLTARASREDKLEGLDTGADDYLIKPFDEQELKVRIQNLIAIREKLQKKFQRESWQKPAAVKAPSVHQKLLEDMKQIIEKNIDNELFGVEELAQAMAMSRSQIHRKLKALTNQSATTFIRNYRLHRAADLLRQGAGNVTEIAFRVGFNSQTYFSSSFAELFGCSPSEYRRSNSDMGNQIL